MEILQVHEKLNVEVAFATPSLQVVLPVCVRNGATFREIIELSGILVQFPELDLAVNRIGVFGKLGRLDDLAVQGDRIEIYRPLVADPKEARRRRVKTNQTAQNSRRTVKSLSVKDKV